MWVRWEGGRWRKGEVKEGGCHVEVGGGGW